jgi:hypothetical protein
MEADSEGRRRSTHSAVLLLLQQITMALAF